MMSEERMSTAAAVRAAVERLDVDAARAAAGLQTTRA
jgi:hypothetical protein